MSGNRIGGYVAWNRIFDDPMYGPFDDIGTAASYIERTPFLFQMGYSAIAYYLPESIPNE